MKEASNNTSRLKNRVVLSVGVMAYLIVLTILLQVMGGAYEAEFMSHPDEAAHYVTGLMVYDYLSGGLGGDPMAFAMDYYDHYPKVAIGHWPPGFYAAYGVWALVFSPSRTSTLVFVGVVSAVLSFLLFVLVRRRYGDYWGFGGATILALLPIVQRYSFSVMTDTALAVLCLLTVMAFIRFLETERLVFSIGFGCLTAAAILTKQSGLLLIPYVGFALLISGKIVLLKKWTFWMGAAVVAAVCVPWLLFNYRIVHGAWIYDWGMNYTLKALPWFTRLMLWSVGYALSAFALLGVAGLLYTRLGKKRNISPFWAGIVSLPLAVLAFHSVVPASIESRYLIAALPAVIALAIGGIHLLGGLIAHRAPRFGRYARLAVFALVAVFFVAQRFEIPRKHFAGFQPIVNRILADGDDLTHHILVSSDASGEGAFIAELAMAENERPNHVVHRGSKALSSSDWMGREYAPRFQTEREFLVFLERSAISWVVIDETFSDKLIRPHHTLVKNALRSGAHSFVETGSFPIKRDSEDHAGQAFLYRKTTDVDVSIGQKNGDSRILQPKKKSLKSYLARPAYASRRRHLGGYRDQTCLCDVHAKGTVACRVRMRSDR